MRFLLLLGLALLAAACGGAARPSAGTVSFRDPAVGVSGAYPAGWHQARALTRLTDPREVVAIASFPLRDGSKAGECGPSHPIEDMPRDGAFVWLLEYRPPRGDPWAEVQRADFPPKPTRFELRRSRLEPGTSCFAGPGSTATFSAADRPFQLLVTFGSRPSDARLRDVEAVVDSLRFDELPPPAPDPYAGWRLVNDNPGDSLRSPPGWRGAAVMFPPETTRRPRPLFFAANLELPDLETTRPAALPALPAAAVVVWVVEEERGAASPEFRAIRAGWPARDDFARVAVSGSSLDVRRAGGSFGGYRFSVWIASGQRATDADRRLAFESAASLALSGCWRDVIDDCPDR
jgi:hypothetical protein